MMYTCIDCGKSFDRANSLHGHFGKCEKHIIKQKTLFLKHFTEKFLKWWFERKHETALHLANLFNNKYEGYAHCQASHIISIAKSYGINTNGFECFRLCKRLHNRMIGKNNILAKGNTGYVKRQETLSKEGVVNVFQRDDVKKKSKETMIERYGVDNPMYLPWYEFQIMVLNLSHIKL